MTTSSKALDRILALEAEVSRLRHHVSILSKRLNKCESVGRVLFTPEIRKFFPGKGENKLQSFCVGNAVDKEEEKEEVAEKVRLVEEVAESEAEVAEEVAIVEAKENAKVVAVDLESVARGSVMSGGSKEASDARKSGNSDKVVVVDGRLKVVALKEPSLMRIRGREYGFGSGWSSAEPIFSFAGGAGRGVGRRETDPMLVVGGGFTPAAIRVSRRPDAWRQSPGTSGVYQLRPRVGGYRGRGFGGYRRGRGV